MAKFKKKKRNFSTRKVRQEQVEKGVALSFVQWVGGCGCFSVLNVLLIDGRFSRRGGRLWTSDASRFRRVTTWILIFFYWWYLSRCVPTLRERIKRQYAPRNAGQRAGKTITYRGSSDPNKQESATRCCAAASKNDFDPCPDGKSKRTP